MTAMGKVKAASGDRRVLANAIRMLAADAVEQAKSGHPGMPMGMADIAEVLWNGYFKHNPANPKWPDRDRFILSNGHGSMLHYALLHLTGYDLPLAELRNFRQLHSKTPGHPEYGLTPGVETTTGPLGQGLANAVGMALAEKLLADEFNTPGHAIVDHKTFVFLGDGCLMEGVSHEACSFAGVFGLDRLIAFYDDNGISIDGHVEGWFADDTPKRFEAYGWRVIGPIDGHDSDAIDAAVREATTPSGKPTLIVCKTVIGWGAPKAAGTHEVHGSPLGAEEAAATRKALGWEHATFTVPEDIYLRWDAKSAGAAAESDWQSRFDAYAAAHPDLAREFTRRMAGDLPGDFLAKASDWLGEVARKTDKLATRKSSQAAIAALTGMVPEFIGGSADLTGSNFTDWKAAKTLTPGEPGGNYIHYGVREFGMTAIMNGIALHGGYIPFGGTFLVFSDYARNAVRVGALMGIRAIHVYTHDSIGLGEDGPTHQPIEHAASLRIIPNLDVWRPADLLETSVAWVKAVERKHGPSALLLSRQNVPAQPAFAGRDDLIGRGGYVLADADGGKPDVVLIATGSEVAITMDAKTILAAEGINARVVSMPSTNVFDRQPQTYRQDVLPAGIRRVAVEAGSTALWWKYVGLDGAVVGIDRFGESAPAAILFDHFGFTKDKVAEAARRVVKG